MFLVNQVDKPDTAVWIKQQTTNTPAQKVSQTDTHSFIKCDTNLRHYFSLLLQDHTTPKRVWQQETQWVGVFVTRIHFAASTVHAADDDGAHKQTNKQKTSQKELYFKKKHFVGIMDKWEKFHSLKPKASKTINNPLYWLASPAT